MDLFMMPLMGLISLGFLLAIAKAAMGLGFVIFVHELGHFLVAKACGVKCEKFYVGFDVPIKIGPFRLPRTLFKKQWGETEYGIGIVPLGGYVKMLGQDDNPANSAKEAERIRQARDESDMDRAGEAESYEIDPRSYPAKTVPQRLAIISAGVVMNLIFAVIFAMAAYRMGVSYLPTLVGSTSPGLSAWHNGLQTGDRILQLGRDGKPSPHLRFDKDMMIQVMMNGGDRDMDLLVQPYSPPGESPAAPEWITVQVSSPKEELHGRPIIGISPHRSPVLGITDEIRDLLGHLPANQVEPQLKAGDRIVSANGQSVADYTQLNRQLAQIVDEPLSLVVERPGNAENAPTTPETLEVTVPAYPVRTLGVELAIGPITGIQKRSIAEQAGFQVGDRILAIDGKPIGDPMRIPDQFRHLAEVSIEVLVQRDGQAEPVVIQVTPRRPTMVHPGGLDEFIPVDAIGIVYTITNEVKNVVADSPAAAAGIQAGDVLETFECYATADDEKQKEAELFVRNRPIELGKEKLDWPAVHERLRIAFPSSEVKLSYARDGKLHTVDMRPAVADDWFYSARGLTLTTTEEVHQVSSWGSAFGLGLRETVESMRQVYFILCRLITGQLSPMNLGGPASIATMAGMEASESTARLLVFLTLLSANLAVVNFLPIPVLDGGHAMFLLYEGVFRKPMPERIAFGLTMVGFCFVLGLMLFVIGLDVWRLSGLAG